LLFVCGLILSMISRWTSNSFQQFLFPRFGLYLFGLIGIPIHEFCHALFAKLFLHDVKSIKWFDPQGKGGSFGCVVHYYNEKNPYHRIGLFFIGMGPVLLAPLILLAIFHFLVPSADGFTFHFSQPTLLAENFAKSLLASQNWSSIGFYLFLYFAVCLTSQMELSPDDLKIARSGWLPFLLVLLFVNAAAYLGNFDLHSKLIKAFHSGLTLWGACFLVAIFISVLNLAICVLLLNLINRLCGRELINPFRNS
jgi:MFS family permease